MLYDEHAEKQEAVPFLIGILMNRWNALHKAYIDDIDIEGSFDMLQCYNLVSFITLSLQCSCV